MSSSKSIIECLIDKNVQPLAFANKEDSTRVASNAIDYSTSNYFYSGWETNEIDRWWVVDFKQNVLIEKYQIKESDSNSNKLYSWTAHASNDSATYELIDSPSVGYPSDKNYTLSSSKTMRYFKIIGENVNYYHCFNINYIKFYGILNAKKTKLRQCTCNYKRTINYNLARVILFCCS